MQTNSVSRSGLFTPRVLTAFALGSCGVVLGTLSFAAAPTVKLAGGLTNVSSIPQSPVWFEPANRASLLSDQPFGASPQQSTASVTTPLTPISPVWSIVNSPNNLTLVDNTLSGIACVSASDCWAAGSHADGSGSQTLIEQWDGSSWTIIESPNAADNGSLIGIACVSASECWAVGYYDVPNSALRATLIERWDGSSWTIIDSPNGTLTKINILSSVACTSDSDCWAVGRYSDDNWIVRTLMEHWDGSSWSIVPSANLSDTQDTILTGLACVSVSDCWAVGYSDSTNEAVIERWDGTSWTIYNTANDLPVSSTLSAVTCASSSQCWAVGYTGDGITQSQAALVEEWNGTSWSTVQSANISPTVNNYLTSVTCASASDCWAVGTQGGSATNSYQTLIERWNGTVWTDVNSPNPSAIANIPSAVACVSSTFCWAAGSYYAGESADHTFVERWDGSSWTIVSTPNVPPVPTNNLMWGVACLSASDCWAAGYYLAGYYFQTLTEHWNGTSWTIVDSPNVTEINNVFYSVSCVSSSDCWAVGHYFNTTTSIDGEGAYQTLTEHWDGNSWTVVESPNVGFGFNNGLETVTCVSSSDCWAVGYYYVAAPGSHGEGRPIALQTLTEHWNGVAWTIVPSANTSSTDFDFLFGVTCTSSSDCWGVGNSYNGTNDQTLIERWDGISWTIISSPNTNVTADNDLGSAACTSATECWAVGSYFDDGSHVYQTLIERWDGSSWTIAASPNAGTTRHNVLLSITCSPGSECLTVGLYVDGLPRTLIERWDGSSWSLASSPNTDPADPNYLYATTCISASQCWAVGVYINAEGNGQTLMEALTVPVQLDSVVSRKVHGSAGTFDVDLTSGSGIECRSGGVNGNYTLVFAFTNIVNSVGGASVTSGTGSVAGSNTDTTDAHNYIVNLTGVTNAQAITISLSNVTDSDDNFSSAVSTSMGVLLGDVNGSGLVDSGDVFLVRQQTGRAVDTSNFREDVNASGLIDSGDVFLTRQQTGTSLP